MFKSSFCTEFFAATLHDRPVHILPPRFHGRNSSENRLLYRKPMPGHARTVSECARACQNHARSAPARAQGVPEPCPHAFQTTSGVVCTQVWTNYPRGRLIPVAVRVVVCLDINAQTLDLAFLVRRIISRMIQHRLRRIRTGARRQLLPPKPLLKVSSHVCKSFVYYLSCGQVLPGQSAPPDSAS